MNSQQVILEADEDDDLPTSKFVAAPDKIEVVVVDRPEGAPHQERAPRLEVTLTVSIDSDSNFYVGFTENLSDGGVFVATYAPKRIGSTVNLVIALPHQMPMHARGTVSWVREYSEANDTIPGMGIRFDRLSNEDRDRILEFARSRQPLFFDAEPAADERVATP